MTIRNWFTMFSAFARREEGQTMAEYGVVLAVTTLGVVVALGIPLGRDQRCDQPRRELPLTRKRRHMARAGSPRRRIRAVRAPIGSFSSDARPSASASLGEALLGRRQFRGALSF